MLNSLKGLIKRMFFYSTNRSIKIGKAVFISKDTKLAAGVKILDDAKVGSCVIGRNTYIGLNSSITYTEVGPFSSIGQDVLCGVGRHPINFVSTYPGFYSQSASGAKFFGYTHSFEEQYRTLIGPDVWIGARAIIMAGVKIGVGAIVGAGAVVTKDVEPYTIVAGVPAKVLKMRFDAELISRLIASQWWLLNDTELEYLAKYMNDPLIFLFNIEKRNGN